jgi:hypothetical protein
MASRIDRIPEVRHHAVAEILRDVAAEALDGIRCGAMIIGYDRPPFFGVELSGKSGRPDQVTKQYRQMSPLAGQATVTRFIFRTNVR